MRDAESDAKTGKRTIIVKFGSRFGQIYHLVLCLSGIAAFVVCVVADSNWMALFLIGPPCCLLLNHGMHIYNCKNLKAIDPELKKLSLSTFWLSFMFAGALFFI